MVGITLRQMSQNDYLGNIQKFGDIVTTELENAMRYYRLNAYQRKSIRWLVDNHLARFSEYYGVSSDDYKSIVCLTRAGFNKITQHILVTLVLLRPDRVKITMEVMEVRLVAIGKKGGMKMLNPQRRGTVPHGSAVLVAVPDTSVLGVRTNFEQ